MVETDNVRSVWIGKKYISFGMTKMEGNKYFFKPFGGLPFVSNFSPTMANAHKIPTQERILLTPSKDTGIKVTVFAADLWGDLFTPMVNAQDIAAVGSLRHENNMLKMELERAYKLMMNLAHDDLTIKQIKKEREKYNAMMGYGSGYSPNTAPMGGNNFPDRGHEEGGGAYQF